MKVKKSRYIIVYYCFLLYFVAPDMENSGNISLFIDIVFVTC